MSVELGKLILKRLSESNLSQGDFAEKIGVKPNTVYVWIHKNPDIQISTVSKIARGFGLTLSEFFDEAEEEHSAFDFDPTGERSMQERYVMQLWTLEEETMALKKKLRNAYDEIHRLEQKLEDTVVHYKHAPVIRWLPTKNSPHGNADKK